MCRKMVAVTSLLLLTGCTVKGPEPQQQEEYFQFKTIRIPEGLPPGSLLYESPYHEPGRPILVQDLNEDTIERERQYTYYWIREVLDNRLVPSYRDCYMRMVSGVGSRGDDAVVVEYYWDGVVYEIVDSRFFSVLLKGSSIEKMSEKDLFIKLFKYQSYQWNLSPGDVHVDLKMSLGEERTLGLIRVDRKGFPGWLMYPIEWYRDGDTIVFVAEKILVQPMLASPLSASSRYYGGPPKGAAIQYRRFRDGNREEMAATLCRFYVDLLRPYGRKRNPNLRPGEPILRKEWREEKNRKDGARRER